MTFTGKDDDSRESKLKVSRRFKTELLRLHPRLIRINPALQIAQKSLVAEGACQSGKQRNVKRFHAIDAKRVNRFGVVAPCHAPTLTRPPPVFAFADRNLVVRQVKGSVCIQ